MEAWRHGGRSVASRMDSVYPIPAVQSFIMSGKAASEIVAEWPEWMDASCIESLRAHERLVFDVWLDAYFCGAKPCSSSDKSEKARTLALSSASNSTQAIREYVDYLEKAKRSLVSAVSAGTMFLALKNSANRLRRAKKTMAPADRMAMDLVVEGKATSLMLEKELLQNAVRTLLCHLDSIRSGPGSDRSYKDSIVVCYMKYLVVKLERVFEAETRNVVYELLTFEAVPWFQRSPGYGEEGEEFVPTVFGRS